MTQMRHLRTHMLVLAMALAVTTSGAMAAPISIELTTDALGLGGTDINYANNNSAVEPDRLGKLVTSTLPNIGSVLTIQTDGLAGPGTLTSPLLVTVTANTYLDVMTNLPAGADFQAGAITLTDKNNDLPKEGLGVRAFGIDMAAGPNYAKRYRNPAYVSVNGTGFQMEGSKEVSGGVGESDFLSWADGQPAVPNNSPPHVDEAVTFDFNEAEVSVTAKNLVFVLTNIHAGGGPLDLSLELTINLTAGDPVSVTYDFLSDAPDVFSCLPGYTNVVQMNLGGSSLGLLDTDIVDRVIVRAKDDPADPEKDTDEHFLINGFAANYSPTPEPATMVFLAFGALALVRRRRA